MRLNDITNGVEVDAEVLVNEDVSEAADLWPRDAPAHRATASVSADSETGCLSS